MTDRARESSVQENNYENWRSFWQQLFAVSTPESRVRMRSITPDIENQAASFVALCDSVVKAVRVYVLSKNDQMLLAKFETHTHQAFIALKDKITQLRGKQRTCAIIEVLSAALQGVDLDLIKNKPGYRQRMQLDDLCRAIERLENQHDAKLQSTSKPVLPATPLAKPTTPRVTGVHSAESRKVPPYRAALGGVLLATVSGVGVVLASQHPQQIRPVVTPITSSSTSYRPQEPLYRPANFIRHTGTVVMPVHPHQSIVYPTLAAFFSTYPTQLQRCFSDTTLAISDTAELARRITDHPDQSAHRLLVGISRRRDKIFTVWWTPDCHEIVFAAGVQTNFEAGYISPRPVTLLLSAQ